MRGAITLVIGFVLLSVFAVDNKAYGAFDAYGNYYCNPSNIELEKIIYRSAVNTLNDAVQSYLGLDPSPTTQKLHNYIVQSTSGSVEPTFNIMHKAKSCLESNGVDPASVAEPNSFIIKFAYAPEFGFVPGMVIIIGLIGSLVIQKKWT